MGKKKWIIVVLVFIFILSSCNNGNVSKKEEESSSKDTTIAGDMTEKEVSSITCSNCKKQIPAGLEKCPECDNDTEDTKENVSKVEEQTTKKEEAEVNSKYINEKFLKNVSDYVELLDFTTTDFAKGYTFKLNTNEERNVNTGEIKKFYSSSDIPQGMIIRLPKLKGSSDAINTINKEITGIFDDIDKQYLYYLGVDYDAFIYNDILSIRIMEDMFFEGDLGFSKTYKTYHFDLSSGEFKQITSKELLDKLKISPEVISKFISDFTPQYITNTYGNQNFDGLDQKIDEAVKYFNQAYENDELKIYKNDNNDYYSLELGYDFELDGCGIVNVKFVLADTSFKMALLSRPSKALGLIYKSYEGNEKMPKLSASNKPIKLTTLNESDKGTPVYISSFSDKDDKIKISKVELEMKEIDSENSYFIEKFKPLDIAIENDQNFSNVYLYHTMLPETMPFESVFMTGYYVDMFGEVKATADEFIYDDMRYGSPIQYVYPTANLGNYETTKDGIKFTITLKDDGTFETSSESGDFTTVGLPITGGTYSSDMEYYYLFPSESDIAAGAANYYVFYQDPYMHEEIIPEYSDKDGKLNSELVFKLKLEW